WDRPVFGVFAYDPQRSWRVHWNLVKLSIAVNRPKAMCNDAVEGFKSWGEVVRPPSLSVQSVVQWLVHGARNAPLSQEVLTELCERLTAAGLPLWRVTVFVRTLHPEIVGRRFVWHPETGTVVTDGSFELLERRSFLDSPMVHVS